MLNNSLHQIKVNDSVKCLQYSTCHHLNPYFTPAARNTTYRFQHVHNFCHALADVVWSADHLNDALGRAWTALWIDLHVDSSFQADLFQL